MRALSITIFLAANLLHAQGACDLPRFGSARLFTGINAQAVATGDFNQDGFPDVVMAGQWRDSKNALQNGVAVALNKGDGTFAPPAYFPGLSNNAVAVADFNHDGNLDIAAGVANGIVVMLGNGDGTFRPGVVTTGSSATGMVVGDFNGDGIPDLVILGPAILLGKGDGTFSKGANANVAFEALAVGDFNGDGKLDVAGTINATVTFLAGDGKGGLGAAVTTSSGLVNSSEIAAADLNGDGKLDVVARDPVHDKISVLLGNGTGTFQAAKTFADGGVSVSGGLLVTDLNGDGVPDVAVAILTSPLATGGISLAVFPGNGDGSFNPSTLYNTEPLGAFVFTSADFNGDGFPDLLIVSQPQLGVIFGTPSGTFQAPATFSAGTQPVYPVLADLNGDGMLDIVVPSISPTGNLSILLGNGDGTFQPAVTLAGSAGAMYVSVGDFNGDGQPDLAVSASANFLPSLLIFLGNGDGTFQAPKSTAVSYQGLPVLGDFNKDGKLDVMLTAVTLLGNGDGTFRNTTTFTGGGSVAVDLNGDGNLDLIAGGPTVQLGNGDGTFKSPVKYSTGGGGGGGQFFAVGDLNGDGKPDLVVVADPFFRDANNNVTSGDIAVLLGNGDGTFQPPVRYLIAPGLGAMVLGDFNGDGFLDLAVSSNSGSSAGGITVALGNGDGTFRNPLNYAAPGGAMAMGDVNGDGQPDLVMASSLDGTAMVLLDTYIPGSAPASACTQLTPPSN